MRACAALELLHASALVHDDYMDASDTRRGRPGDAPRVRGRAPRRRLARRPGAVRRRGGDPARRPAARLGRRHAAPLRAPRGAGRRRARLFELCRTEVIAGQFLDVSVQARGRADVDTAMTVLRYKSAKYSIERPLHIGAALAGAAPEQLRRADRVRPAPGRGVPAARRPAGRVRRPRGHRQAGRRRPGRGQAHGAGGPGARRRCRPPTPRGSTRALGTPAGRGPRRRAARDHRRLRRPRAGRAGHRRLVEPSPLGRLDERRRRRGEPARGVLRRAGAAATQRTV